MRDRKQEYEEGRLATTGDCLPKDFDGGAPDPEIKANGQHACYWILSDSERAKGFVRPVRTSYFHTKCQVVTTMGRKLAETCARDPSFYGSAFCCGCGTHLPVGETGDFIWDDGSGEKVGT